LVPLTERFRFSTMLLMEKPKTYPFTFMAGSGFRGNPWYIHMLLQEVEGRWECVGLRFENGPGKPVPITPSTLRKVPLGRLIQVVRVMAESSQHARRAGGRIGPDVAAIEEIGKTLSGERSGRARMSSDHFVKVARTYQDAYRKGANPTQTVAKTFQVSKSTAAKWVHRCRTEFGLLPKTSRGKAVGATRAPKRTRKTTRKTTRKRG
jgi:hypothetical protein